MTRVRVRQWLRYGLLLGGLGASLGADICQADELTDQALQAFRSQAPELNATARSDDELQVTGRKGQQLTVYLANVRAACAANQGRCGAEMASFVQRAAAVASADPADGAFAPEKVHAVLRSAGFAKRAAEAFKEPEKQLVVRPFARGIELLFVVDGDKAVRYVNHGDIAGAGLTEPALLDLASRNATRLPEVKAQPVKNMPGLFFMPANDGLGTSRAFDAALWDKLAATAGGPVALAVPTRDWLLFTRADQPEQVTKLRTLAGRITRGEPYPVSDTVLARDGNGWKALQAE